MVPDAADEGAPRHQANLSHILAGEYFILAQDEPLVLKRGEVHAIATSEAILIGPVGFDYFVDVAVE